MAESARRASGINASADAVPPRVQWFVVEGGEESADEAVVANFSISMARYAAIA